MSGRLQDEVENAVDQLLTLALSDVYLAARATDQWLADLSEADNLEHVADSHRCFFRELQRIAARDLTRRFEIAASWFGASSAPAHSTVDSELHLPQPSIATTLAGAALDATNLKALRSVLYGPHPGQSARSDDGVSAPHASTRPHQDAAASPGQARAPRRAGPAVSRTRLTA